MKKKKYELIGCCGMSCSLCPRFHTNGKSKCLGCGPDPHCQYCATYKCCTIKNNIESGRVVVEFYGETKPAASNATLIERRKNRRVEFVMTDPIE